MDCGVCVEKWQQQYLSACEQAWERDINAHEELCEDAILVCLADAVSGVVIETGIGAIAFAVAIAACIEIADDCQSFEYNTNKNFEQCIEECLSNLDDCRLQCI